MDELEDVIAEARREMGAGEMLQLPHVPQSSLGKHNSIKNGLMLLF
jgi:hypothetical protein